MLAQRSPASECNSLTFIDVYAGCGGLSLGLFASGWQGLFAVEKDPDAFRTLSHNFLSKSGKYTYFWPEWLPKQTHNISTLTRKYRKELDSLRGKVDLIAGGPPCQGFSFAGKRDKNDPRNLLFRRYIELVKIIQPSFVLMENVKGITVKFRTGKKNRKRAAFSDRIRRTLERNGYTVFSTQIRATDLGVPQRRPRFILIAVAKSRLVKEALASPFAQFDQLRKQFLNSKGLSTNPVSVKEAISDLAMSGKALVDCPDSKGFQQIRYDGPQTPYQRLMRTGMLDVTSPNSLRLPKHRAKTTAHFQGILDTCRKGVCLSKNDRKRLNIKKQCIVALDPDAISHTLTTLPDDLLHYSEPRILTVRESARLQSFPDWYEFKGKYTTGGKQRKFECPRYTQVGNAVPPMVAEFLGRTLTAMNAELSNQLSAQAQSLNVLPNRFETSTGQLCPA
jgi:DNA (cytosine-5)-methyltransferase 1